MNILESINSKNLKLDFEKFEIAEISKFSSKLVGGNNDDMTTILQTTGGHGHTTHSVTH